MTRGAWLVLPLLLLALAPPARAAEEIHLDLFATEVNGVPTFTDASGAANPTLHATPGARLTIHLKNLGTQRHNLLLDAPLGRSTPCCLGPGEEANLTVDLPADFTGSVVYECSIHGAGGMRGVLLVGAPPPTVEIVSPANGTTVHGPATVQVRLGNATLGQGWSLQYALDGAAPRDATEATIPLGNLTQGNHLVEVRLLNATGVAVAQDEAFFFEDSAPVAPPPASATPSSPPASTAPAKTPVPFWVWPAALALVAALRRSRSS